MRDNFETQNPFRLANSFFREPSHRFQDETKELKSTDSDSRLPIHQHITTRRMLV